MTDRATERPTEETATAVLDEIFFRTAVSAITQTESREEIERIVCECASSRDGVRFAWIGGVDDATGTFDHRTRAGLENGYLRAVSYEESSFFRDRYERVEQGKIAVVDDFDAAAVPDRHTRLALERGFRSVAFVPLTYRSVTYGVLAIYADRPSAFPPATRSMLRDLGETVGYAISATKRTRALVADSVVELEFAVHDTDVLFVWLSDRVDCRVTLDGLLLESDGSLNLYVRIAGADPAAAAATVQESETVADATVIDDRDLLKIHVRESPIAEYFADQGAVLRTLEANCGEGTAVIELPSQIDARSFVEQVTETFPGVDLVAKRERTRQLRSQSDLRKLLAERLTDRQHEALQVAYHAGFYEWPRDHSGSELAERLEVSQPTFLEHLRAAERKLLAACFDDHWSVYSRPE